MSVTIGGCFDATASVSLNCVLDQSDFKPGESKPKIAFAKPGARLPMHTRDAVNGATVQRDKGILERSPESNAETVREELKRQVIEFMLRQRRCVATH